jgi:hypothetical protein
VKSSEADFLTLPVSELLLNVACQTAPPLGLCSDRMCQRQRPGHKTPGTCLLTLLDPLSRLYTEA